MKNYENRKALIKEDILDGEENLILEKGNIVLIKDIECSVDGFGTDYVNVIDFDGNEIKGVSTYCMKLI